jgi:L-serine deaminase
MEREDFSHGDLHREIGALKADVANLKEDVREVRTDVKQLVAVSEQTKGGWKVVALVGGVAGSVGGFFVYKLLPKLLG